MELPLVFVLTFSTLFHSGEAVSSQFLGGTFWWTASVPTDPTKINLNMALGWSSPAACSPGQQIGDPGIVAANGAQMGSTLVTCVASGSPDYPYSVGTSTLANLPIPAGSPFGIYTFDGGPWRSDIPMVGTGNWRFQTVAQTPVRPDTRIVNQSPVGGYIPQFILSKNCPLNNGTAWNIPAFDPDQDLVNCRFGSVDECGSVCGALQTTRANFVTFALAGPTGCALTVVPRNPGTFGVGLQLDDYADISPGSALSTVPVQFLITVRDDGVTNCATKPSFVSPTVPHMACLGGQPNVLFAQRIYMQPGVTPGSTITNVLASMPSGMTMTGIGFDTARSLFYTDVTWINPTPGVNFACFTAVNSLKLTSDPQCMDICVGAPIPQVISVTPNFTATGFNPPVNSLVFTFNMPVISGFLEAHFRVSENVVGTTTFRTVFDEAIPRTSLITFNQTTMTVDLRAVPWRAGFTYKIDVDNGIAINQNCCGIFADMTNAQKIFSSLYVAPASLAPPTVPVEVFTTKPAVTTAAPVTQPTLVPTTVPVVTLAPTTPTTIATTTTPAGPTTTRLPGAPIIVTIPVPIVVTVPPTNTTIIGCNCTQPDWPTILGQIYGNLSLLWRNASYNIFNNFTINLPATFVTSPPIYITIPPYLVPVPPSPIVYPPPPPPPPAIIPSPSPIYLIAQPVFYLQPFIAIYAYPQYQISYYNFANMVTFGSISLPFDAFSRGVVGTAIVFNGNQYITVQPPTCNACFGNLAACTNGLSMCTWYMPLAVASTDQYVLSGFGSAASTQPQVALIQTATLGLQVYVSAGQNAYFLANSGANTLTPATWSYVCFSYQQNTGINLYINGVCLSCANPSMGLYFMNFTQQYPLPPVYPFQTSYTSSQCMLYVARPSFNIVGGYGRFAIDQFQVWQNALSPVAIYQLYATADPSFLWAANVAPPATAGSVLGTATFVTGYNGMSLQCSKAGDGVYWSQPLYGTTVASVTPTVTTAVPTYTASLTDSLTAAFKFQLLQPTSQIMAPTQGMTYYWDIPIFAMTVPTTATAPQVLTPPKLALSYDPLAGFRALYWANGTVWFINGTPSYAVGVAGSSPGIQYVNVPQTFVSSSANQLSLTPWRDVLIRGSPTNGLQLFLDGNLAGTGTIVSSLPIFGRSADVPRNKTVPRQFIIAGPPSPPAYSYYAIPSSPVDVSQLNMYLCSPSTSTWFYQPNQLFPIRIDSLQLWPVYLPDSQINLAFSRNTYGTISLSGRYFLLPTLSGMSQVPFTIVGNPLQITSPYGPAIQFQGSDQIRATFTPTLCYFSPQYCTDGFTICSQVQIGAFGQGGSIFSNLASATADGLLLYVNANGTITAYVHYGTAVWSATSSVVLVLRTFASICFSWSPAGGIHLSINGVCAAVVTRPQPYAMPAQVAPANNAILIVGTGMYSTSYNTALWQFSGGIATPLVIPRQAGFSYQAMTFALADIKLWNSKFYPSELFPHAVDEQTYNSQMRSSQRNGRNNNTDSFEGNADEPDSSLTISFTWWPIVVLVSVGVAALFASLMLLISLRYNAEYYRKLGKDSDRCSMISGKIIMTQSPPCPRLSSSSSSPSHETIKSLASSALSSLLDKEPVKATPDNKKRKRHKRNAQVHPSDENNRTNMSLALTFAAQRYYTNINNMETTM